MQPFHGALGSIKGLAVAALLVTPVTTASLAPVGRDSSLGSVTEAFAGAITAPAAQGTQHCHGAGALIRTPRGRLRDVSLARGLRTYQHKAPGSFVRLCDPAVRPSRPQLP
ncbi:hypothetical protein P5P86_02670 [Nocardioides sp. BP30]|uniref:hypothetical protein n=1 Tax=Nocardioides sp. BP30 TaxID=3036374 RepID=UPI0024684784|nr:hypothetical protein [Nocardioides sp. BP30]WGL52737.1 hypothetical protein P5P86_02670 [Nocardioides sp. BP30]